MAIGLGLGRALALCEIFHKGFVKVFTSALFRRSEREIQSADGIVRTPNSGNTNLSLDKKRSAECVLLCE